MPLTRSVSATQAIENSQSSRSGPSSRHSTRAGRKTQKSSNGASIEESPPAKRVKSTQVPRRGKKASLSRLLDMPPEVFNEITTHLFPMDLLSLARSNHFFRNLFMSRTSQRQWRQALSNVSAIPPCPPNLSEPQYVSLIFSKTCSSCGARVLRRMDPFLYVRLCNSCRDEQTLEIPEFSSLFHLLPTNEDYRHDFPYTLRSEFFLITDAVQQDRDEEAFTEWQNVRFAEICKRQEHGKLLKNYLNMMEEAQEIKLDELKHQRQTQIEMRLHEEGWSNRDVVPSPTNRVEWNKLIWQVKPITDRVWTNLYPKLVPLLESNRTFNEQVDKEKRRRERTKKLQTLVLNIQQTLPPLVHLTLKASSEDNKLAEPGTSGSATLGQLYSRSDYPDVKIELPFPAMVEFLTWPMIKRLVDDDIPLEDLETRFEEIRDEFDRAVVEWRGKIEGDLVEIWNTNRDEDDAKPEPSTSKGKGKQTVRANTQKNGRHTMRTNKPTTEPAPRTAELVLPEFIATYTKPDGTTTTNISDLPANLQLLLRADTMFASSFLRCSYPGIVRPTVSIGMVIGGPDELMYGERWDPSIVKRDDEGSAVAQKLLARVGRSQASAAEMKALGGSFSCGRCNRALPDTWGELVEHYATEQNQWRKAQESVKALPEFGFVFNNTHDLEPGNTKPFAHFMTREDASDYTMENSMHTMIMMTCMRCEELGIQAQYFHASNLGFESPIKEHLRDVHGITVARAGLHFRQWEHDVQFFDPFESDEGSLDSEEELW